MFSIMLIVTGGRKIVFTGRKDSLRQLHSNVNFAFCGISVNCPGIKMGCESLGGSEWLIAWFVFSGDLLRISRLAWSHKLFQLLDFNKVTHRMTFGKGSWIIHQRSGFSGQCRWIYLQFVIQKQCGSRLEKGGEVVESKIKREWESLL